MVRAAYLAAAEDAHRAPLITQELLRAARREWEEMGRLALR